MRHCDYAPLCSPTYCECECLDCEEAEEYRITEDSRKAERDDVLAYLATVNELTTPIGAIMEYIEQGKHVR